MWDIWLKHLGDTKRLIAGRWTRPFVRTRVCRAYSETERDELLERFGGGRYETAWAVSAE